MEGGLKHRGSAIWDPWIWPLSGCIYMIEHIGRVEGWVLEGVVEVLGAGHLTQRNKCCFLLCLICIIFCLKQSSIKALK